MNGSTEAFPAEVLTDAHLVGVFAPPFPGSHGVTPLLPAVLLAWMAGSAFERGGGQNPVFAPRYPPCRGSDLSHSSPGHLAAQAKAHLPRATQCSLGSRSRLRASFRHLQPGRTTAATSSLVLEDRLQLSQGPNHSTASSCTWNKMQTPDCDLEGPVCPSFCGGGGTLRHSSPIQAQDSLPPSYPLNKPSSSLPQGLDAYYETVPGVPQAFLRTSA